MLSNEEFYELKNLKVIRTQSNQAYKTMLEDYINSVTNMEELVFENEELQQDLDIAEYEIDTITETLEVSEAKCLILEEKVIELKEKISSAKEMETEIVRSNI